MLKCQDNYNLLTWLRLLPIMKSTWKIIRALSFLVLVPFFCGASILRITVDAPIHPITSEYIRPDHRTAPTATNARLLIMAINTPGGLDTSMREIIETILNSKVPVAAYVSPERRPVGLGRLLHRHRLRPLRHGAGDQHRSGPPRRHFHHRTVHGQDHGRQSHARRRLLHQNPGREKRGRNVQMAEDAVRKSLSYTEKEALKGGLIDLVAKSDRDIIEFLDGRSLKRFSGEEHDPLPQRRGDHRRPMSSRQNFLLTISNPNLAYILLMIGLLGLYFEFAHPGAILPGVLGGISLLLAIFSFQILPINYVGPAPHPPGHRPVHPRGQGPQLWHALRGRYRRPWS